MYGSYENIDIFLRNVSISIFTFWSLHHCTVLLTGSVWWVHLKNYINNLLTLVIWKCVYDEIVDIIKKGINIFSNHGFLRVGGHTVAQQMWPPAQLLIGPDRIDGGGGVSMKL